MKKIPLGDAGVDVSAMCLGAMRFGTATAEEVSFTLLDMYGEAGGSFIDTANVYAAWEPNGKGGESETVLGRWMKSRANRDKLFLATKLGSRFQSSGFGMSARQIQQEVDASLKRLGVEMIDLLYAHFDDRKTSSDEVMGSFDRLVKDGKVRHIGASNFRAWRLEELRGLCDRKGWAHYCCIEQRYTYLQPVVGGSFGLQVAANEDLLDYCASRNMRLVAYSPLLKGFYGRKERPLNPQSPYLSASNDARLQVLEATAKETGATVRQVVLAWMLRSEPAVIPIMAASTPEQMRENLGALDVALSSEQMARLDAAGTGKG